MKKTKRKLIAVTACLLILCCPLTLFAHSGRTDANGGHKDNQNKSGLGSYHYHCGGNPPHLHDGGVCPYASSAETQNITQGAASQESSAAVSQSVTPAAVQDGSKVSNYEAVREVYAESLKLELTANEIKVNDTARISTTIMPENTTDKNITYTSSNEEVATVSLDGEIKALSSGTAVITAETSNNIAESIEVTVIDVQPVKIECEDAIAMVVGDLYPLKVEILPSDSKNKEYTVTCEDEDILKYCDGELQAVREGVTSVHVKTWNGIEEKIAVWVDIVPVNTVTIIDTTDYMYENVLDRSSEIKLQAEVLPEEATYPQVSWSSSDERVVAIENGRFVIKGTGEVTLTCTTREYVTDSIEMEIIDKNVSQTIGMIAIAGAASAAALVIYKKKKQ